jgi:hypothetical protein
MTPEQVKALRAGDGVVHIRKEEIKPLFPGRKSVSVETKTRYIVNGFFAGYVGLVSRDNRVVQLWVHNEHQDYRRETFIEFLTRPDGMGETSWWAVSLPNIGLTLIALKYGNLWYWPAGTAVVFNAVLVIMGWRNYTHKTV